MKTTQKPPSRKLQPAVWVAIVLAVSSVVLLIFGPPFRKGPTDSRPAVTPVAYQEFQVDPEPPGNASATGDDLPVTTPVSAVEIGPVQLQADGAIIVRETGGRINMVPVSSKRPPVIPEVEVRARQGKKQ